MNTTIAILILTVLIIIAIKLVRNKGIKKPKKAFPPEWRMILFERVNYYRALDEAEKGRFEYEVQKFLLNKKVTGINTEIDDIDRLLIASGAVMPIFGFPQWDYLHLDEVILYPSLFNENHETSGDGRAIKGMVGSGYMDGKMILSKASLRHGFKNTTDKKNVAIHEFTHLIDKTDGKIDGIPKVIMDNQNALPWFDLIIKNIEDIYQDDSDINPYGATDPSEFLAVATEYFFERPKLMKVKHPELYHAMEIIFNQKMAQRHLESLSKKKTGRNDPCPCGSGKKHKHCCGK